MKYVDELCLEIKKRRDANSKDDVLGNELRMHRLNQNLTLIGLSKNMCSASYLSKVETNQMMPNKVFLEEICDRLSIDNDSIDSLVNSKENVINCLKAFLSDDIKYIETIVKENEGLISYRMKIIEFIYYLGIKDLVSSSIVYELLSKNIKSMGDYDIAIFALFSGIFHFNTELYDEARKEFSHIALI